MSKPKSNTNKMNNEEMLKNATKKIEDGKPKDKVGKVSATLIIEVVVNCPHCGDYLDLTGADFPHLNGDGEVLGQIFRNDTWREDFELEEVECPECGKEFEVEGIEW